MGPKVDEQKAAVVATHVKASEAHEPSHPPELLVTIRCTDEADQAQLADRLRREGRIVTLFAEEA
jgi:hypothetical protein